MQSKDAVSQYNMAIWSWYDSYEGVAITHKGHDIDLQESVQKENVGEDSHI